jgi:hypothetical protein
LIFADMKNELGVFSVCQLYKAGTMAVIGIGNVKTLWHAVFLVTWLAH